MKVVKYTKDLQNILQAKTKPEPWLHCAILDTKYHNSVMYAIYVWDTRQVLENSSVSVSYSELTKMSLTTVYDNHKELLGRDVENFNSAWKYPTTSLEKRCKYCYQQVSSKTKTIYDLSYEFDVSTNLIKDWCKQGEQFK